MKRVRDRKDAIKRGGWSLRERKKESVFKGKITYKHCKRKIG